MAATNPNKSEYQSWVSDQVTKENGLFLGWITKPIINAGTTHHDYIFFSVFETKIQNEKVVSIGAFNHFKTFENEK